MAKGHFERHTSFGYKKNYVFQVKLFPVPSKNNRARRESPLPAHAGYSGPERPSDLTQQSSDSEAMSIQWVKRAVTHCCSSVTYYFWNQEEHLAKTHPLIPVGLHKARCPLPKKCWTPPSARQNPDSTSLQFSCSKRPSWFH